MELSDFRPILEIDAVRHLVARPEDDLVWPRLEALHADHYALLDRIETDFRDLSKLDERFHATVTGVVPNRFVLEFQKVVSLIFHYHSQWDKAATREHLLWIAAVQQRDGAGAVAAARADFTTSKQTLLSSLRGHNLG